jgi:hypothetical protein
LNWRPIFTTHIATNKEEAASFICTRVDDIKIYSDSSSFKGMIGAAATILATGHLTSSAGFN